MTPLFMSNLPHRCIIAPSNFCSTRNFYTIPVMPGSKSHLLTKIFLFQCTGIFTSNHKTKKQNYTNQDKTKTKANQNNTSIFSLLQIRHWERKAVTNVRKLWTWMDYHIMCFQDLPGYTLNDIWRYKIIFLKSLTVGQNVTALTVISYTQSKFSQSK